MAQLNLLYLMKMVVGHLWFVVISELVQYLTSYTVVVGKTILYGGTVTGSVHPKTSVDSVGCLGCPRYGVV